MADPFGIEMIETTRRPARPMSNFSFRVMTWLFRLVDLFSGPQKKLARLPLRPGMTVVDYACGPGRYTIPVAQAVGPEGRVYAVDIQPLALKVVGDKAARLSLGNVESVLADSYTTRIPEACADLVLLLDAFYAIGDRPALLRELRRVIKPAGLLIIEPGHMNADRARETATGTGLFRHLKTVGKDMHFAPAVPLGPEEQRGRDPARPRH